MNYFKVRQRQLQKSLQEQDASHILVNNLPNIYYLTGIKYLEGDTWDIVLLCAQDDDPILYVPRMLAEQISFLLPKETNVEICILDGGKKYVDLINSMVSKEAILLFEDGVVTYREYRMLSEKLSAKLQPAGSAIENIRIVKDKLEIQCIKKAVSLTEQTLQEVTQHIFENDPVTYNELDVVELINSFSKDMGGEGVGFDSIVASGMGSSIPHYSPRSKQISNDILLLDLGIKYDGYSGDISRTYLGPKATKEMKDMYKIVREAHYDAINMVKPGRTMFEIHSKVIEIFKKHGVEKNFIHSIGHGLGLDMHEQPFVSRKNESIELKENMVITIEPGLYFEGKFGIRIEDVLVVTNSGADSLSNHSTINENKFVIK
ncbi:aminopeptidase P family protein [Candidatus Dojkabacteria bacterium]|uniref:Aminopeptidase P family protein n=1 Tax=Candidatus Dojkabacteria bacterium TaxID=2099670 RepID=A0A955RKB3_9BACT|nr:aminopeptidase P family protein [Candidatus Dojkabacteria bacterium]